MENDQPSELEQAQDRLKQAVLKLPLNPTSAAVSAMLNSALLNARLNAITAFITTAESVGVLEQLMTQHMNSLAETFEAQTANAGRIQLATGISPKVQ